MVCLLLRTAITTATLRLVSEFAVHFLCLSPGPQVRDTLKSLPEHYVTGVVSGRSLAKLRNFVNVPGLFYAGSHGFDILAPSSKCTANCAKQGGEDKHVAGTCLDLGDPADAEGEGEAINSNDSNSSSGEPERRASSATPRSKSDPASLGTHATLHTLHVLASLISHE